MKIFVCSAITICMCVQKKNKRKECDQKTPQSQIID